jgi:hypothetical protein
MTRPWRRLLLVPCQENRNVFEEGDSIVETNNASCSVFGDAVRSQSRKERAFEACCWNLILLKRRIRLQFSTVFQGPLRGNADPQVLIL